MSVGVLLSVLVLHLGLFQELPGDDLKILDVVVELLRSTSLPVLYLDLPQNILRQTRFPIDPDRVFYLLQEPLRKGLNPGLGGTLDDGRRGEIELAWGRSLRLKPGLPHRPRGAGLLPGDEADLSIRVRTRNVPPPHAGITLHLLYEPTEPFASLFRAVGH